MHLAADKCANGATIGRDDKGYQHWIDQDWNECFFHVHDNKNKCGCEVELHGQDTVYLSDEASTIFTLHYFIEVLTHKRLLILIVGGAHLLSFFIINYNM